MEVMQNILYLLIGFCTGVIVGVLGRESFIRIFKRKSLKLKGFYFHHSLLGFVALGLTPFLADGITEILSFVGFSVGLIIEHGFRWGPLTFITRVKD